jgi:hypothetical protein
MRDDWFTRFSLGGGSEVGQASGKEDDSLHEVSPQQ